MNTDGLRVRTAFCRGVVVEELDGTKRRFWTHQTYYRIRVTYPRCAAGTMQIIAQEEVRTPCDL